MFFKIFWHPKKRNATYNVWMLGTSGIATRSLMSHFLRLFQHTEMEHTPNNLYQQAIKCGIPFIVLLGDWFGVCSFRVCCNFLGTLGPFDGHHLSFTVVFLLSWVVPAWAGGCNRWQFCLHLWAEIAKYIQSRICGWSMSQLYYYPTEN